jgi:hypothetical protein
MPSVMRHPIFVAVILAAVTACLAIAAGPAGADFVPEDGASPNTAAAAGSFPAWGELTGDGVRFRSGASTRHQILMVGKTGDKVIMLDRVGDWVKVQGPKTMPCWVIGRLVNRAGDTATVRGTRVNVRLEGNMEGMQIGQVTKGMTLTVLDAQDGWLKIAPPPGIGPWVHGAYVKRLGAATDAEIAAYIAGTPAKPEPREVEPAPVQPVAKPEVGEPTPDPAQARYEAERKVFLAIQRRANAAAGEAAGDAQVLADKLGTVIHDFDGFADACTSADLAEAARLNAKTLRVQRATLLKQIADGKSEAARLKAEADARIAAELQDARDAAERRATQADESERRANAARLAARLFADDTATRETAVGEVRDQRDADGRRIYILVVDGKPVYRLESASSSSGAIDLTRFWRRQVAATGRIVNVEGDTYPTLICEAVEAR